MRMAVFSTKGWVQESFERFADRLDAEMHFLEPRLTGETVSLAEGYEVVCVFVNDQINQKVLQKLKDGGTKLVALRCAGFNNVDVQAAYDLGVGVVRVPAYSPHAVAEHTVALMLTLNRKIHRAYARVRESNLSLDGLMGFDLHGKTVGVIGTGRIGTVTCGILRGFGCEVIACDKYPNDDLAAAGVEYVDLEDLYRRSDIITLHCPLTRETKHMIDADSIGQMKEGVMIVNTSRGALVDTEQVIDGLKNGRIGYLALDVYEEEGDLFFEDLSDQVIQDDVFARLLTFPNVIVTGHQAFFTREAVDNITETTFSNIREYFRNGECENLVLPEQVVAG